MYKEKCVAEIKKEVKSQSDIQWLSKTTAEWLDKHENGVFLGCYYNKLNNCFVAVCDCGVIYLLGKEYPTIVYSPKLLFHYKNSKDTIHIDDIVTKGNGCGNGTSLMRALFRLAEQEDVKSLTGFLSNVDLDHRERQLSYYTKFGFSVDNHFIKKAF